MSELPDPLVPPDLDLRGFRWMKLDLLALFNSDFNTTTNDTAWRAGVTLWGKSWHQVPSGSLPDNDAVLCHLAGLGRDIRTWKKIRDESLHGFVKCSDGRLYHRFICRMAEEARADFDRDERRRERDRMRKSGGNSGGSLPEDGDIPRIIPGGNGATSEGTPLDASPPPPSFPPHPPNNPLPPTLADLSGEKRARARRSQGSLAETGFDEFWQAFPHRASKGDAEKAWPNALRLTTLAEILAGVERYKRDKSPDIDWCHPASWLNKKRWLDEPPPDGSKAVMNGHSAPRGSPAAQVVISPPWEARCRSYASGRRWHPEWGPPPGDPGCFAPPEFSEPAARARQQTAPGAA